MRHTLFVLFPLVLFCIAAEPTTGPATKPSNWQGRIVTPDGKPVAGARVDLMLSEVYVDGVRTLGQSTTDANGVFQFLTLPPSDQNRLSILARAPGFGLTIAGISPANEEPAETVLAPATTARVKVIDSNGKPVAGLRVFISRLQSGRTQEIALCYFSPELKQELAQTTDADGMLTLPDMPQEILAILEIPDDRYASLGYDDRVLLSQSARTQGQTIRVRQAGSISGRVVDVDGKPVAGLRVAASGIRTGNILNIEGYGSALTDTDGKYTITRLTPSNYSVSAYLTPAMKAKYAAPALPRVHVAANTQTSNQDIKLVTGGIVSGAIYVVGKNKLPSFLTMNGVPLAEDGTYMYHVMPGLQRVRVAYSNLPGLIGPQPGVYNVDVDDGQTVKCDFQFSDDPSPGVKGVVVDSDGKPMAGATVTAMNPNMRIPIGSGAQTRSDSGGNFTLPSLPSGSQVRASKGQWNTAELVAVDDQHHDLKLVVHKDTLSSVLVKLRLPDGSPAVGANITLMLHQGMGSMGVDEKIAGDDGNVVFKALQPGAQYDLWAGGKGFGRDQVENLVLIPGQQIEKQITIAKGTSFVAGSVVDVKGDPVPDVEVDLDGESVDIIATRTDSAGRWRFDGIVPGATFSAWTFSDGATSPNVRAQAGMDNVVITHILRAVPQRPMP